MKQIIFGRPDFRAQFFYFLMIDNSNVETRQFAWYNIYIFSKICIFD